MQFGGTGAAGGRDHDHDHDNAPSHISLVVKEFQKKKEKKRTPWPLVRKQTIPTERLPLFEI
jgi:hypothetical protein